MSEMIIYTSDSYKGNCKIAAPFLPKGCRFLELGETIPVGARALLGPNDVVGSIWVGSKVHETLIPVFVKKEKPAWRKDPLEVTHSILPVEELRRESVDGIIADFIKTVSTEKQFRAYLKAAKKGLEPHDYD